MCSLYHAVSQINQIKSLMENRLLRARASDRNIQPWLLRDPRVDFLFEDYIPVSFAPELLWKACLVDLRGETEREREATRCSSPCVCMHDRDVIEVTTRVIGIVGILSDWHAMQSDVSKSTRHVPSWRMNDYYQHVSRSAVPWTTARSSRKMRF